MIIRHWFYGERQNVIKLYKIKCRLHISRVRLSSYLRNAAKHGSVWLVENSVNFQHGSITICWKWKITHGFWTIVTFLWNTWKRPSSLQICCLVFPEKSIMFYSIMFSMLSLLSAEVTNFVAINRIKQIYATWKQSLYYITKLLCRFVMLDKKWYSQSTSLFGWSLFYSSPNCKTKFDKKHLHNNAM